MNQLQSSTRTSGALRCDRSHSAETTGFSGVKWATIWRLLRWLEHDWAVHLARAVDSGKAKVGRDLTNLRLRHLVRQARLVAIGFCLMVNLRPNDRLCGATVLGAGVRKRDTPMTRKSLQMKGYLGTRALGEVSCLRCNIGVLFVNGLLLLANRETASDNSPAWG